MLSVFAGHLDEDFLIRSSQLAFLFASQAFKSFAYHNSPPLTWLYISMSFTFLVTGSGGFLGSALIDKLSRQHNVIEVSRSSFLQ